MKYYFRHNEEICHNKETHLEFMRENDIKEMDVFEAKKIKVKDWFYCRVFGIGDKTEELCRKSCPKYSPRNGKFGICKNQGSLYEETDNKLTLKL